MRKAIGNLGHFITKTPRLKCSSRGVRPPEADAIWFTKESRRSAAAAGCRAGSADKCPAADRFPAAAGHTCLAVAYSLAAGNPAVEHSPAGSLAAERSLAGSLAAGCSRLAASP